MKREILVLGLALLFVYPVYGAPRQRLQVNEIITTGAAAQGNVIDSTEHSILDGALVTTEELNENDGLYANSGLFERFSLVWVAGAHGMPGVNTDVVPASADDAADGATKAEIALLLNTDLEMEVLGSNGTSDDVIHDAEGGIALQTDGTGTDSVIILPHLDSDLSPWTSTTWGTDKSTIWECVIVTGSDITPVTIWAGLKLTNTPVTSTDADQVFFRFQDTNNDGEWEAISSGAAIGSDDEHDTDIVVAISTVYHLKIMISATRIATMYINGTLVETTGALDDTTDLIPYIGILEGDGNAKDLVVRGQAISRVFG